MKYQHYFGKAHVGVAKGKPIFAIGFRNEGFFKATFVARKLNWTIKIGETTKTMAQLSASFAGNASSPLVQHFKGVVNVPGFSSGATNTIGKGVMVKLSKPYIYKGGNLLFEIIAEDVKNTNTVLTYNVDRTYGGGTTTTMYGFLGSTCVPGKNTLSIYTSNMKPGGSMRHLLLSSSTGTTGFAINIVGLSIKKYGAIPLPFSLAPFGAKGCYLLTDMFVVTPKAVVGGKIDMTMPLPNLAALNGIVLNTQFLVLDKNANSLGIATTALGQRMVTATGGKTLDCAYLYWTGNGKAATQANANSGPWKNRADVMLVDHL
jgi:hypothetical protein